MTLTRPIRRPAPPTPPRGSTHRARPVAADRRGDLARAACAALLLLALLVGLPAALAVVGGNPLPHRLPSLAQVGAALTRPDPGTLLTQTLLLLAWAAWAGFALAVAAETYAQLRGRTPPRLAALTALQRPAAGLVAAVALAWPTTQVALALPPTGSPAAVTAPPTTEIPATSTAATSPVEPAAGHQPMAEPVTASTDTSARDTACTGGHPEYVVRAPHDGQHDTLWSIAATCLGDPLRWHEIAHLNLGRPQPDGTRMTDPHWIRPGWQLLLPTDAVLPATPPAHAEKPTHAAVPPAVAPRQPSLVLPTPDTPSATTVSPPTSLPDSSSPGHTSEQAGHGQYTPTSEPETHRHDPADLLDLVGAGLLAAGIGAALARARVVQRRHRPTGAPMPRPVPELLHAESHLRVLAEPDDRDFLDTALRSLPVLFGDAPPPVVSHARLATSRLTLHLIEPMPHPPEPFASADDGHTWVVDHHATLPLTPDTAGSVPAPYPGLVPLGHDSDGLLLVDLHAHRIVAVTGDHEQVLGVLRWTAAELAVAATADDPHVTLVGFGAELVPLDPERLTHADRLTSAVLRDLADQATFTPPGSLTVLLLTEPPDDPTGEELVGLANHGGLTVVCAGDWPAAHTRLRVSPDNRLTVEAPEPQQPHIQGEANRLAAETATTVATLVDSARASAAQAEDTRPLLVVTEPPREQPPAPETDPVRAVSGDQLDAQVAAFLDPYTAVPKVGFLGPVQVTAPGEAVPYRTQLSTEIVVYLAAHGRSAPGPALETALWPDRAVTQASRNQAVARARRWLGTDPDGTPHLQRSQDGVLTLGPGVLIDWELFTRLTARGFAANGDGHHDLATALRLVRGQPFAHVPPRRYTWLPETYLEQDVTTAIVDAAHRLATRRLAAHDFHGARDAARTAQLVDRYDERPWRDLILAEENLGNTPAVDRLINDLLATFETEDLDDLTSATQALIEHLRGNHAVARGSLRKRPS